MKRTFLTIFLYLAGGSLHAQNREGVTLRLYDIREGMDKLYPLSGSPTPNLHEYRETIDFSGPFSNRAYSEEYAKQFIIEIHGELHATVTGSYGIQLHSNAESVLTLDGGEILNSCAATFKSTATTLTAGWHPFVLRSLQDGGAFSLRLEWKPPGTDSWSILPKGCYRTESAVLVSSPGKKDIIHPGSRPGNGQPLIDSHPQWDITDISLHGFAPQVGGMGFLSNGDLLVASFEPNTAGNDIRTYNSHCRVYRVAGATGNPEKIVVKHIAGDGLTGSFEMKECTGMAVVNDRIYAALRDNIYQLSDTNGDGILDTKRPIIDVDWSFHNFHQFPFSIKHVKANGIDYLYGTISTAIAPGGLGIANSKDYNGCLFRVPLPRSGDRSAIQYLAGGLRTPNGVSIGPEGRIFVADNQGSWNPANSLTEMRPNRFYGHHNPTTNNNGIQGVKGRFEGFPLSPKSILLPQNTVSNSPTEGVMLDSGPFAGQMILGELTAGGLRRIFFDKVQGEYQGAVFHFSQGFEGGVNRIIKGPDNSLYIGCMGSAGNWSWKGTKAGLMRFSPKAIPPETLEMKAIRAIDGGLEIEFTRPVPAAFLADASNFKVTQWTYEPTANYGGPNIDEHSVTPQNAIASSDCTRVRLQIPDLKEGYVVHIVTDPVSTTGQAMWTTEAWYSLNHKTDGHLSEADATSVRYEAENAEFTNGPWIASDHPGFTGKGFLARLGTSEIETIAFKVNAPSAGKRKLTLRYARGLDAGIATPLDHAGSLQLTVNGTASQTIPLAPGTDSWSMWKATAPQVVELSEGQNTIVITNPHPNLGLDGVCNIDRIDIDFGATEPTKTPVKFRELFNGKDLTGWNGAGYNVENGMIVCSPAGRNLITDATFSNYVLDFDFLLTPGANNGLGIHYPGSGDAAYVGMEVQILDSAADKNMNVMPSQHHGSLYKLAAAKQGALKPAGEWNHERILVKGSFVRVVVNGIIVLTADLDELSSEFPVHQGCKRRSGQLVFCGHGDRVAFRNIRLGEL